MLIDIVKLSEYGNGVNEIEVSSQYFNCKYVAREVMPGKWFVFKVRGEIEDIIGSYRGENAKDRAVRLAIEKASQHIAHIVKSQGKKKLTEILLAEIELEKGG